jgi:chromosome segregation ATPase
LISELRSALAKLKVQEDLSNSTARKLQVKEQELAAALESLENKELELRQAKAESDAQKQRLESIIEDLEGEIQQLQEAQTETETQGTELSGTIENLRTELEQLQAEKNEMESQVQLRIAAEISATGRTVQGAAEEVKQAGEKQMANENQTGESVAEMRKQLLEFQASNEVLKIQVGHARELQASNGALKTQVDQARADHASIMRTLRGVSGMIQGVLGLGRKGMMVATLQSVLGMLRGVLNLDTRVSNPASGTKHARVKEEDDYGGDLVNVPKRFRQAEHVDLTEEL